MCVGTRWFFRRQQSHQNHLGSLRSRVRVREQLSIQYGNELRSGQASSLRDQTLEGIQCRRYSKAHPKCRRSCSRSCILIGDSSPEHYQNAWHGHEQSVRFQVFCCFGSSTSYHVRTSRRLEESITHTKVVGLGWSEEIDFLGETMHGMLQFGSCAPVSSRAQVSTYYTMLYARIPIRDPKWTLVGEGSAATLVLTFHTVCACSIIYRDIKPDNIGFDVRGVVKIFDFGLAKELRTGDKDDNGTYKLTGDTGTLRYMAPEVYRCERYNVTCDVYSFCILVWQILKLETPFAVYSDTMLITKVLVAGKRPMCDPKWPQEITEMLKLGWGVFNRRPSMDDICATLRDEIHSNTGEEP
jgi:hypothetical protein